MGIDLAGVSSWLVHAVAGRRCAFAAVVIAGVLLTGVSASAGGSPPEGPDLATMALATSDFARGAAVAREGFLPASSLIVAKYGRYFAPGARLGGQRLLSVACLVDLFTDTGTTSLGLSALRDALSTPAGQRVFAKQLTDEVASSTRGTIKVKSVAFGRVIPLQSGFRLKIRIGTSIGPVESVVAAIAVDRAIGLVNLDSYPRKHITATPAVLAAQKLAQHFQAAFRIRNVTAPAILGTPHLGATLTADRGRWAGGPSAFTYQWNHCDASGANCVPLAGAVSQTYVPGTADAGTTLTVTVTATNSVSSTATSSRASAPVS
jgi:hypothetical protein